MIKIIDDIIPKASQQRILKTISDRDFRWYYRANVTYRDPQDFPMHLDNVPTSGYSKATFFEGEIDEDIAYYTQCLQLIDALTENGIKVNKVLRIQTNLMYRHPSKTFNADSWNTAHTDQNIDHKVLLYYANDSDGDTFLFNQKREEEFNELTVRERVSPKMGRAVIFDGNIYHASSNPIKSLKRLAININFI